MSIWNSYRLKNPYRAELQINGRRIKVGSFATYDQAQTALDNAEFAARYVVLGDDVTLDLKTINEQLEKLL